MNNDPITFLFPGQASQYVGMGRKLCEEFPSARNLYEQASDLLGFDLKGISFDGPADTLRQTVYTQPAILVHSVAVSEILSCQGITPSFVAGHSLGEYSALVSGGYLNVADTIKLVKLRSALMQEAGEKHPGTMAAIIGLDPDTVDEICSEASKPQEPVQAANYNSPQQIAVAGAVPAVHRVVESARKAGAKRAVLLEVSGAFHSVLMEDARASLTEAIRDVAVEDSEIPVIANVSAEPVTDTDEIRNLLIAQLTSPVRWSDSMTRLGDLGCEDYLEVGPGKVLKGLMRRINRSANVSNADSVESIQNITNSFQKATE